MNITRRLMALVKKEGLQVVRDPSCIVIAFVLPLVLLFLFGYGISLDAKDIFLGVALEDEGWEARDLAMSFAGSPYFNTTVSLARQELFPLVTASKLRGVLVIPHGFSAALYTPSQTAAPKTDAPKAAVLQLAVDGTFPNTGGLVQNYSLGVVSQWMNTRAAVNGINTGGGAEAISVEPRFWYNSEMESRYSILPGIMALIMALIGTMLTSLVVAREWERGTMEALLSTPTTAFEILLGKLIPYYLLAMFSTFFSLGVAVTLFEIPFRGSIFMLFCVSSLFMFSALGQGLVISSLTRNQYLASFAALMSAFLPATLLSGFVFEINSMPLLQRTAAAILPAHYLVNCLLTLFLAGDIYGVLLPNMLKLAALGLLFLAAALRSAKKRLD